MNLEKLYDQVLEFIEECKRIWLVLRKPTKEEFITVAKITGLGISLLGIIGYIIHVPISYIKGVIKP
ncbi:protein translocase SEC61 complex, gamma subunit [Methanocaldococcus infernus ME]|uniref:Protein translocase subunit SecE n=1 Tax=Methanocaldococcus infernus (strain DSM 11812 / JCM 15783 / ME) TaxID=573063 RepID=D5VTV6_METIM|nr:protein translocase SEC61 complex subunit gamma [Methanocaldococcus infernus]ADG14009.1 protein translocase SEC61 complex, gamma subunit [Methanocaldococcus infernus ME]